LGQRNASVIKQKTDVTQFASIGRDIRTLIVNAINGVFVVNIVKRDTSELGSTKIIVSCRATSTVLLDS
jgi:hypothetical protein